MSRICDICGKGYQKANLVPRGIGNRVTKRTITKKMPNLRSKKLVIGGNKVKVTMCASCLKRLKKDIKDISMVEADALKVEEVSVVAEPVEEVEVKLTPKQKREAKKKAEEESEKAKEEAKSETEEETPEE